MQKPHHVLIAGGYIALVGALVVTTASPGQSQGGPPQGPDVRVVNTTSEPVPVSVQSAASITGSVAVTNTPNVNVTNAVTTIPGYPGTPFTASGDSGFTTPADKHLVIETVSVQVDVTPGGTKLETFINYTSGGRSAYLFLPVTFAYHDVSTGYDFYVATQPVRVYPDPGTSVYVSVHAEGGNHGTLFLTASGYLN